MSEKKTVLITGCSAGGIGLALAKEFQSQGFRVFATARRLEAMEELTANGIETLALDVTDIDAIRRTREDISTRTGGKLNILVNNAGRVGDGAVSDMDMSVTRALFETNLFAPMCMVQEFLPLLIASREGCVVNNGSITGIVPVPFSSAYNSAKAALHSFGNTLRIELAPFNVRVVTLMTGAVKSNILKPYSFPDNSLYISMQDLHRTRHIEQEKGAMPAAQFARIVVAEMMKTTPRGSLWAGTDATLVWFAETFLPRAITDWMVAGVSGMLKLAGRVRDAEDKKRV
ncbi:NAD-P-binding protein [Mycena galopus ATCC 62051]|nr:NAD-P-binding protein [Mycena galopus ATCC 62051]